MTATTATITKSKRSLKEKLYGLQKESTPSAGNKDGAAAASPRTSINSSDTTVLGSIMDSTQVQGTHRYLIHQIAAEAAEERRADFRYEIPTSLHEEVSRNTADVVAPFRPDEIVLGPKLGSGEFSHVYEVHSFHLQSAATTPDDTITSNKELEQKLRMKKIEKFRQTENARYALKHLKEDYLVMNGEDAYVQAAGDLALEAEFLANLAHPNIIKLRGLTHSSTAGFANGPRGYYLIIDRLIGTLDQRIKQWHGPDTTNRKSSFRFKKKRMSKIMTKAFHKGSRGSGNSGEGIEIEVEFRENEVMDECFDVAVQISAAMKYLHSHSIIFRDLKPANVGFDVRGDVKIFDFGLSRFMPQGGHPYNDLYEMSGAGSPRYMAPECIAMEAYNLKADTYTFAIVLWEMLTGKVPYSFVRSKVQLMHHVVIEGGRPEIDECWPDHVKGMLESSFDANYEHRPTMLLFYDILRHELASMRDSGDGLRNSHIDRRRSAESVSNAQMKEAADSTGEELDVSLHH